MISIEQILERHKGEAGKYKNCISLGWFCGTASALSKLGLRSHSGPFDWYFSSYKGVLANLENDFADFMKKDNLVLDKENPKTFFDTKYGFHCNHDVKNDFEEEYADISAKYSRRVEAFREMVKSPTVFFRAVENNEEVLYINNNWQYAHKLVERYNSNNRIIYVLTSDMDSITENVESYRINIPEYKGETYDMRHLFDTSKELLNICSNLIDISDMEENINFDNKENSQKASVAYVNKCIEEDIVGVDFAISDILELKRNEEMFIWGAGKYGSILANYLKRHGVRVIGFIDNNKSGEIVDGFQVYSIDNVPEYAKIFIAVSNKQANVEIKKQIIKTNKSIHAVGYGELYEKDIYSV
ncbi:DUF1796 family putative cysteine peptidase [Pseudobutyrivibrio sp.]|uniref:DUF1796 family putative cysteine peptidase n=1 Tax=Pseudobutyrivibrio sp. TaxID=2014367 RepID=UPI0025CB798D|nr:DUF1796 family putative cysteine peptidase [Pseudobutyrivibrio sp.]